MASRVFLQRVAGISRQIGRRPCTARLPITTYRNIESMKFQQSPLLQTSVRTLCSKAKSDFIINIQDEKDFQQKVIESSVPVVVDFHANWCGPCKTLGPRLEALIASQKGKVILAKVDVDEQDELAMAYKVMSIPMVLAVKDGKTVNKFIGLQDDDQLETFIEKLL